MLPDEVHALKTTQKSKEGYKKQAGSSNAARLQFKLFQEKYFLISF
jgi:hypothetical protein